ncbi:HpcH/HpaI aldolase/citrate lyase family protein [Azohydromonas australica]|uniref:HpcH/HpaI aldolase/citrate lyase family protein n=1 Tax=Azohydromonas australica TaxID=364039 RepID=UPI0003F929B9|nr:CoA ester lyase [Azohydromonas australica]
MKAADPRDIIGRGRSLLFVPASRPERLAKALASSADLVIVDLEDAVPAEQKSAARDAFANTLPHLAAEAAARLLVRINSVDTPWHGDDLRCLADGSMRALSGVVVPKAEAATALQAIGTAIGPDARVLPLVESLAGLDAVDEIARVPQVARLIFGHLDFQLDLGLQCTPDEPELMSVRLQLVAASRRASLPPPVDGVTANIADGARLQVDTLRSRALGFTAKLCIHPAQADAVNAAFSPTAAELEWAGRVVAGAQLHRGAAFSLDGRMIDLPVIRLAERVLQRGGLRSTS